MIRVSGSFDDYLEEMAQKLSESTGRPVSKTEASRILAAQGQQPRVVYVKKRGKRIAFGSDILHL